MHNGGWANKPSPSPEGTPQDGMGLAGRGAGAPRVADHGSLALAGRAPTGQGPGTVARSRTCGSRPTGRAPVFQTGIDGVRVSATAPGAASMTGDAPDS